MTDTDGAPRGRIAASGYVLVIEPDEVERIRALPEWTPPPSTFMDAVKSGQIVHLTGRPPEAVSRMGGLAKLRREGGVRIVIRPDGTGGSYVWTERIGSAREAVEVKAPR